MESKINYRKEMLETVETIKKAIQVRNYRKARDYTNHLLKILDYDKASKYIYKIVLNKQNEKESK